MMRVMWMRGRVAHQNAPQITEPAAKLVQDSAEIHKACGYTDRVFQTLVPIALEFQ
jgi:hypothetical protein